MIRFNAWLLRVPSSISSPTNPCTPQLWLDCVRATSRQGPRIDATITRSLASKTRDSIATGGGDGNYVTCKQLGNWEPERRAEAEATAES